MLPIIVSSLSHVVLIALASSRCIQTMLEREETVSGSGSDCVMVVSAKRYSLSAWECGSFWRPGSRL